MPHTEQDLDNLIREKLSNCGDLPLVCKYSQTPVMKDRIVNRVKEIIFNDGIDDVDAAFAQIEDELTWEEN